MGIRTQTTHADGRVTVTDTRTLDEAKAERIAAIKETAQARIYAIAPAWKQANLTAEGVALVRKEAGAGLTAAEQQRAAAIEAIWQQISAIRVASDQAEAAVLAATTNAGANAVPF